MNASINHPASPTTKGLLLAEIVLVFGVFLIQGATPPPEVNEPTYLGKAIHYWNPDWGRHDFFLAESADDTHVVFYFTFGWLALLLPQTAPAWTVLAWFGRVLTWGLMAWAWRRLSSAVVPGRWWSILTAALFVGLIQWCHLAGEWVIGGVEAKGFAFVLVFLGLEALVRDRWNRTWLLLGAAAAFHVLVGGWSVAAAAIAWIGLGKDRPSLRSMWPAILGGLVLSLPGLVPALMLNWGTGADVELAHQIYVFERLTHHLAPWLIPVDEFILRFTLFGLLLGSWLALCLITPAEDALRRLRAFVAGAIVIALVGALIGPLAYYDPALAARLLRFYWFRLADVAVPLGVALGAASLIVWALKWRPVLGKCMLAAAVAAGGVHVGIQAQKRLFRRPPQADRLGDFPAWWDICDQVARSEKIPSDAIFLTPRMAQTFKWYTGLSEVVNWKEIPQDAEAIGKWWRRINDIHATGNPPPGERWYGSLAKLRAERLKQLGRKYDAGYVLTVARPRLPLKWVVRNRSYVVYRLPGDVSKLHDRP